MNDENTSTTANDSLYFKEAATPVEDNPTQEQEKTPIQLSEGLIADAFGTAVPSDDDGNPAEAPVAEDHGDMPLDAPAVPDGDADDIDSDDGEDNDEDNDEGEGDDDVENGEGEDDFAEPIPEFDEPIETPQERLVRVSRAVTRIAKTLNSDMGHGRHAAPSDATVKEVENMLLPIADAADLRYKFTRGTREWLAAYQFLHVIRFVRKCIRKGHWTRVRKVRPYFG